MKRNIDVGFVEFYNQKGSSEKRTKAIYCFGSEDMWFGLDDLENGTQEGINYGNPVFERTVILSYEEKGKKYHHLLDTDFSFSIFTNAEFLKLLEKCMSNIETNKIVETMLEDIIRRDLDISEISKRLFTECAHSGYSMEETLESGFRWTLNKDFLRYCFKKKDYFTVLWARDLVEECSSVGWRSIPLWDELISAIKEGVSEDIIREYDELDETAEICRHANFLHYLKKLKCFEEEKQENKAELKVPDDSLEHAISYIDSKICFKDSEDIKLFLDSIEHCSYNKEIEAHFFEKIITSVKNDLIKTFSIMKFLNYFDGKIVFKLEENNRAYDELRKELLLKNKIIEYCIEKILLQIPEKEKNKYQNSWIKNNKTLCYNREYYSDKHKLTPCSNMHGLFMEMTKYPDTQDVRELLHYFNYIFDKVIEFPPYNYTVINVPARDTETTKERFELLIRMICLLTGVKNGFNALYVKTDEKLKSRREGGAGIIDRCQCRPVSTKYGIIIDDILATGKTMDYCKKIVKNKDNNLEIKHCIFFARQVGTVSPETYFEYRSCDKFSLFVMDIYSHSTATKKRYFGIVENEKFETEEDIRKIATEWTSSLYKPSNSTCFVTVYTDEDKKPIIIQL